MNAQELIVALELPTPARLDRRVPKKLLLENGAPTAADKRLITDGVEELHWIATLKPSTIGVAAYRDDAREYLEINILSLKARPSTKVARLVQLVHRAVPYPILLVAEEGASVGLSAAHKRHSLGEAGKTVLDGDLIEARLANDTTPAIQAAFVDALALRRQPTASLFALYDGWINTLLALHASRITDTFAMPPSHEQAIARRTALIECQRLDAEISRLRAAAAKEKQVARQVELNLTIQRLEADKAVHQRRL